MALPDQSPRDDDDAPPQFLRTYEGRQLLPGEVPLIPYYAMPAGQSRRESHQAATALFADLAVDAATAAVRGDGLVAAAAARCADRWQCSSPEDDITERTVCDEARPRLAAGVEHAWGDAGQMIEDWFNSGEVLAAPEEPAPEYVVPEPSIVLTWLGTLCDRVRRVWGRPEASLVVEHGDRVSRR